MSVYRHFPDGRMQRLDPETGDFYDCDSDEPRTRIRKHDKNGKLIEGMIVAPASWFGEKVGPGTYLWKRYIA